MAHDLKFESSQFLKTITPDDEAKEVSSLSHKYKISIPKDISLSNLAKLLIELDMQKSLDTGGAFELLARHGQQGIEFLGNRNIEALKALDKELNVEGIQLDLCHHIWKIQVAEELEIRPSTQSITAN